MAQRPFTIALPRHPGTIAAVIVLAATMGPMAAVLMVSGQSAAILTAADWSAVRFTLLQAFVSAGLSVVFAIPVARAIARRSFAGRSAVMTVMGAPFLLPVIVAINGILAIYGRSGVFNQALASVDLPAFQIYGLTGVVLAHVFLNLPLAIRFLLQGWLAVPSEHFRLAATLNASVVRQIEIPMLRATLPGAFLLILLLCLSSFAVALILGRGPRATTVELAIYQAIRFQFDLGRAASLAMIQTALCLTAAVAVGAVTMPTPGQAGSDRPITRFDAAGPLSKLLDLFWIALVALFLGAPLFAVVMAGIAGLPDLPVATFGAAARSVVVAVVATALAIAAGLALAMRGGRWVGLIAVLPMAVSSMVLGTGYFVLLNPYVDPACATLALTAIANAVAALPFVVGLLAPAVQRETEAWGRLSASLGITGWSALKIVILPRLRAPLSYAAGLSVAFAMGDFGVIALFGSQDTQTLPLLMANLMGSYRTGAAAGVGCVLVGLSLALFWLFDKGGRARA